VTDLPEGVDFLRGRAQRRQQALDERSRLARRAVEDAARELLARFGATRVVLFGSLAREALHERSDVDVAVWGLAASDEGAAADLVAEHVGLPVDLVRMEVASDSLEARIEADGVDLATG